MAQQMSRAERLKLADEVIQNDGDLQNLSQQVAQLNQRYLALSSGND
jgi:dephospho-CoA kinase